MTLLVAPAVLRKHLFLLLLGCIALTGAAIAFPWSYVSNTHELVGLCLMPFAVFFQGKRRFNYFFFGLLVLFGAAAFVYNVRLFYFFALAFYLLWLIELHVGSVNPLVLFLLVFMSPFFVQAANIFGFPIRLQLSSLAGRILQLMRIDVTIDGNMMLLNGNVFTVDDACMGLNMLAMSMLMGVFVVSSQYRKQGRQLAFWHLAVFFLSALALNVVANLFRIVILVLFEVMPDDPMHEVVGLLCLGGYVLIPLYFLAGGMTKYGRTVSYVDEEPSIGPWRSASMVGLSVVMLSIGIQIHNSRLHMSIAHPITRVEGLRPTMINDGITKLENESILMYVKPIPEFFSGEHTPLLCWKGSGYVFKGIKKTVVAGQEIYLGQLVRGREKLFTAWWYSNGEVQTVSQAEWRWRMLKGETRFCLVNVTAKDEAGLVSHLGTLLEGNMVSIRQPNQSNQ